MIPDSRTIAHLSDVREFFFSLGKDDHPKGVEGEREEQICDFFNPVVAIGTANFLVHSSDLFQCFLR